MCAKRYVWASMSFYLGQKKGQKCEGSDERWIGVGRKDYPHCFQALLLNTLESGAGLAPRTL